ncbi:Glucose dehydrogenase [FAD, quinone] [Portunus trituberculatus]|uniref:Glucose dehydrogenase [FAD, quinone] n=1 Tax=Portunus trituberculatus TaxID=210409 RepID=A0A5B7HJX2_PORTR|nr:Glucose dehydrogenase [FAD, quinone] [Portunus trituberculatus]
MLGGTSAINGMLYVRGNKRDFDNWAALGNPGWDYESVLPYFKKAEGYRGPPLGETEEYHGRSGPLTVVPKTGEHLEFTSAFKHAGLQLGFRNIDPSGPDQIGELFFPPHLFNTFVQYSMPLDAAMPMKGRHLMVIAPLTAT